MDVQLDRLSFDVEGDVGDGFPQQISGCSNGDCGHYQDQFIIVVLLVN